MMQKRDKVLNLVFSLLAVAAVWLAWVVAYYTERNDLVVPSVGATFKELGQLLAEAAFWGAFSATLLRTVEAFAISFVLGLACALLAAVSRCARVFFAPIVSLLRTVPTMALVLILLLWTRSPSVTPVIIAMLVLFPMFYSTMLASLDEVRSAYGDMARDFRVPRARQAFCMYLPLMAPPVLGQMGATISLGLKITISGEVLAATATVLSLGGMMQQAALLYMDPARLMALTIMAVAVGFAFEGICFLIKKLIVRRIK